ncbi:hypothetical protein SPFM12_00252 [Salmonella phage SPFM12]|nr:hypothetical protein SPFM12_00252 [Salmonella phage SPFM12]
MDYQRTMERYLSNDLLKDKDNVFSFIMKTLTPGGRHEHRKRILQGIASIDELLKTVRRNLVEELNTLKGSTTKEAMIVNDPRNTIYDPPQERFETIVASTNPVGLFFTTISVAFGPSYMNYGVHLMLEMLNVSLLTYLASALYKIETSQFYLCRNVANRTWERAADDFAARFGAAHMHLVTDILLERPFVTGSEGLNTKVNQPETICKEMSKENILMQTEDPTVRLKVVKDVERMLRTLMRTVVTNLIADAAANRITDLEVAAIILHEVGHVYYY